MPEQELPDRSVRASDHDRDAVGERLREALGEGRISVEEYKARLDRLTEAKTYGELEPLTSDLPQRAAGTVSPRPAGEVAAKRTAPQIAVLAQTHARPQGPVAERLAGFALLGNAWIDLRHAQLPETGLTLTATALCGAVDIIVPPEARVDVSGFPLCGSVNLPYEAGPEDGPRVDVRAFALFGAVTVHRKAQDED